jgi:phosphosulfolactate phosphohydrolase-like enzyme
VPGTEVLLEWGPTGAAALAPDCDVAVVVDVLTFSTTVSVAADRGVDVVPYRWADGSAAAAAYRLVEGRLGEALWACPSGQELVGRGFPSDVTIAAELDASVVVPRLVDGVLTARR